MGGDDLNFVVRIYRLIEWNRAYGELGGRFLVDILLVVLGISCFSYARSWILEHKDRGTYE